MILSCLLIYIAFDTKNVFWYLYTATSLFLISYAIVWEKMDDELSFIQYASIGLLSGIVMYALFYGGSYLLEYLPGNMTKQVSSLYKQMKLDEIWHYLVLVLVIVPGEEIFWRGFVQKKISRVAGNPAAIILAAVLSGIAFSFSGYTVLMVAGIISGLIWGYLYVLKRSMPLLIVSHLVFDILLLIIFPIK